MCVLSKPAYLAALRVAAASAAEPAFVAESPLLLFCIRSPPHSFIPGFKPSFSANPIVAFLFFFGTDYMVSTDCLLILLSISVYYFLVFLFFTF